jgi:hypothetical protein
MDIGDLVAASTYFFESDPAQVGDLERMIFAGYLAGLRHAGWAGDERLVRLGYTISVALRMGVTLPGWAAVMLDPASGVNVAAMYGRSAEEVLAGWVTLAEFSLDRADEARQLMAKCNYSGCIKLDRHLLYLDGSLMVWRCTAPRKVPVKWPGG